MVRQHDDTRRSMDDKYCIRYHDYHWAISIPESSHLSLHLSHPLVLVAPTYAKAHLKRLPRDRQAGTMERRLVSWNTRCVTRQSSQVEAAQELAALASSSPFPLPPRSPSPAPRLLRPRPTTNVPAQPSSPGPDRHPASSSSSNDVFPTSSDVIFVPGGWEGSEDFFGENVQGEDSDASGTTLQMRKSYQTRQVLQQFSSKSDFRTTCWATLLSDWRSDCVMCQRTDAGLPGN